MATDAGGNDLLRIRANGSISTLATFPSRAQGRFTDSVPTTVVSRNGAYYVGELTGAPFVPGEANIYKVVPGQAPTVFMSGFSFIIDMTFGPDGSLYVGSQNTQSVLRFDGSYLVPRPDGRYALGATVEERGFALRTELGGVYELLREAHLLVPGVSELEIEELCVGLRPGTPDNLPAIGQGALGGLVWATGHYRNGILLAPLTAELVLSLLAGESSRDAELLSSCSPLRFAEERGQERRHATLSPPEVVT